MLVEPCGGSNCVSIVNSTSIKENDPTQKYDLNQCGMVNSSSSSITNKALHLKVSTSVKNTLRPAEYPWLVSLINQRVLMKKKEFLSLRSVLKVVRVFILVQLHFVVVLLSILNG